MKSRDNGLALRVRKKKIKKEPSFPRSRTKQRRSCFFFAGFATVKQSSNDGAKSEKEREGVTCATSAKEPTIKEREETEGCEEERERGRFD